MDANLVILDYLPRSLARPELLLRRPSAEGVFGCVYNSVSVYVNTITMLIQ
uniref:Uncharacterized protein n=1 Tax=Rhizophora mucronata TaxID=61149 RepID=A0A2P2K9X0_RHIMU